MKPRTPPHSTLLYPQVRKAPCYSEQSSAAPPAGMGDTRHHGRFPIELHPQILDALGMVDKLPSVQFRPAGGYPSKPLIPTEHLSGTAIYVEIILRQERLKDGGIGFLKRTSKRGDGGSNFAFWRRLLGCCRWWGKQQ